ncbi:phage GP46 family protein [Pseudomonas cremoricolorata]|uniref:Phage GP46 n=1 Tax=Pseudomonas cremoricolorata TaxID=157783 RepID=A0A089WPT0_9PSED|nr:phage GP46 family protein [Pseudomonas cremoricolorata]AIR90591.1 phage GP46 [Pseudomonas cremoricolorata]
MSREALLRRAVTISLFTWRRAEADDALDDTDRKGWWGDCTPTVTGDRIGSRLWLLQRRTITAQTLRDAREYAEEALAWLIDDEIVTAVTVTVERQDNERVNLRVTLTEQNGETLQLVFEDTWSLINAV